MNFLVTSSILLRDRRIAEITGGFAWYRIWVLTNSVYMYERPSADVFVDLVFQSLRES